MRISDWSSDVCSSDLMIAIPVGPPRSFAVVASPSYFKVNDKPRTPPDLLRHSCIRVRLPTGALHRWHFEKNGQPGPIDVPGPTTLDAASLRRIADLDDFGTGYIIEADDIGTASGVDRVGPV